MKCANPVEMSGTYIRHLRIGCKLEEAFWRDQPRIRDSRLCEWLEFKLYRDRKYKTPLPLVLVQSGRNAYKVRQVNLPAVSLTAIGESKANVRHRSHDAKVGSVSLKPHQIAVHSASY